MSFTKITEEDLHGKGNTGKPDVPNLDTAGMQHLLDELSLDVIIPKLNNLIDELEAATAAGSLGILDGEDESDVQTVIDDLKTAVSGLTTDSHTHTNKDELDTITQTLLDNIDSVLLMLTGISSVASSVTDTPSAIPTCRAIVNYVSMLGGGDMMKSTYDSDDDGVVNDSDKLGGELPSYYQAATDSDLETTDKTVVGAINEVNENVGDLSDLETTDQDSAVDAINEVRGTLIEAEGGSTIETIGESAIGTYDVGELFVADDGFVYKAIAIIAVGNTLSGSNCTKTNIKAEINSVNTAVANKVSKFVGGGYVPVDSLAYDSTNKKLGLKVNGADTVIPFSGGVENDWVPYTNVVNSFFQTTERTDAKHMLAGTIVLVRAKRYGSYHYIDITVNGDTHRITLNGTDNQVYDYALFVVQNEQDVLIKHVTQGYAVSGDCTVYLYYGEPLTP